VRTGIEVDCPIEVTQSRPEALLGPLLPQKTPLQIVVVGFERLRLRARGGRALRPEHLHLQRPLNRRRDLLVNSKDVRELAFIALRPEMTSVGDVNELHRDADTTPRLADAALQHLAHVEQLAHFANVPGGVLELKTRRSGHDSKAGSLREAID
jgi:hypothetical protein